MKIKRIIAASAAFAMLFSAAACSGEGASGTKKTLKVGCETPYPPFEYFADDGVTPVGVDIELGQELGKKLGYDIELIYTEFDNIFTELDNGDFDCAISAITITDDRLEGYLFSDPYIQNYQCIVTMKDAEVKPASLDDIAGLRVGYQESTTSDDVVNEYAKEHGISFESFKYAKLSSVFSELEKGRIDAVICDSTVASSKLGADSDFVQTWIQSSNPEEFAVCFKKGDEKLRDDVNKALAELKKEGKLQQILDRYF